MFRACLKSQKGLFAFIPLKFSADIFSSHSEQPNPEDVNIEESGLDRLKNMFETDEFGTLSPEFSTIMEVASMSLFVGALYGGTITSRTTYMDFIKNNEATAFRDHIDAKRKLHDAMVKSFGKGAFRWGWRMCLFCTTFVGLYTLIQVYRGKYGYLEYVTAGGITGFLYKFNLGPRGWIVGGGLGSVLGLIGGGMTNLMLTMFGLTMEETRYWRSYSLQKRREKLFKAGNETVELEQGGAMLMEREKRKGLAEEPLNLNKLD